MKTQTIFYFFILSHSLGVSKVCGSRYNPNNFTSMPQMEADGWVFPRKSIYWFQWKQRTCRNYYPPGTSFCGFIPTYSNNYPSLNSKVLTLSLELILIGWERGKLVIDYGQLNHYKTALFINGLAVDDTNVESKTYETYFNDGDVFMLAEWGIMLVHSIEFTCFGELDISDSSEENITVVYNSTDKNSSNENITIISNSSDENITVVYNSTDKKSLIENITVISNSSDENIVPQKSNTSDANIEVEKSSWFKENIVLSLLVIGSSMICGALLAIACRWCIQRNWQEGVKCSVTEGKVPGEVAEKVDLPSCQTGECPEQKMDYMYSNEGNGQAGVKRSVPEGEVPGEVGERLEPPSYHSSVEMI